MVVVFSRSATATTCVDEAEGKVGVLPHQVGSAAHVGEREVFDRWQSRTAGRRPGRSRGEPLPDHLVDPLGDFRLSRLAEAEKTRQRSRRVIDRHALGEQLRGELLDADTASVRLVSKPLGQIIMDRDRRHDSTVCQVWSQSEPLISERSALARDAALHRRCGRGSVRTNRRAPLQRAVPGPACSPVSLVVGTVLLTAAGLAALAKWTLFLT